MTEDNFYQNVCDQKCWNETLEHQERMALALEQEEYNLFSMLHPTLKKDGNQWCVLYGQDLQNGIAGFGDTPRLAILDWNKRWDKQ